MLDLFVALRARQVDRVLERVSRTALWQHTSRKPGRWKRSDCRAIPRQAVLLPRLGDMLGERRRWTPLPRLATERHARSQWRMVYRVNDFPTQLTTLFTSIQQLTWYT
jgi:hypothetical protein